MSDLSALFGAGDTLLVWVDISAHRSIPPKEAMPLSSAFKILSLHSQISV
jgi:hypothetical protein